MNKKILITILSIIFAIILIIMYINYENVTLKVSNYIIKSTKIPIEFNNYKIVQISDFHNTKSTKLTNDLINKIKKVKPNIIVITGDLIDSRKPDINIAIELTKKLNQIAPVYYVNGNHESRIKNYNELKNKLIENNVAILDNRFVTLEKNNSKINLIGINDPSMTKYSNNEIETTDSHLNNINFDENNYKILLSHRPELLSIYAMYNIDLIFTGHAHGGQIRIPFIGGIIAPNQGLFPKYTEGIHQINNSKMIVSRGIGNSIFPFRINNRPELVVATLNNI